MPGLIMLQRVNGGSNCDSLIRVNNSLIHSVREMGLVSWWPEHPLELRHALCIEQGLTLALILVMGK